MLNVKTNFRNAFNKDEALLQCRQCPDGVLDTQQHVTVCSGLQHRSTLQYEDLFDKNIDKVKSTLIEYMVLWDEKQSLVK